jgi:hypothetical protein
VVQTRSRGAREKQAQETREKKEQKRKKTKRKETKKKATKIEINDRVVSKNQVGLQSVNEEKRTRRKKKDIEGFRRTIEQQNSKAEILELIFSHN